jgi:hypothetical protein
MLNSVRSERLLMEEVHYRILYRWFVALNLDDQVWDATSSTKSRDRLPACANLPGSLPQRPPGSTLLFRQIPTV